MIGVTKNNKKVNKQIKIKWWQRILCRRFCPRYAEDMPVDKPGLWVACSLKRNYVSAVEIECVEVEGLRNAYEVARWLALKLDFKTPQEFGISWAVRKPNQL